ncbi:MAG: hypothetical protein AAF725_20750, partial [Acidobacteriota bacterium]
MLNLLLILMLAMEIERSMDYQVILEEGACQTWTVDSALEADITGESFLWAWSPGLGPRRLRHRDLPAFSRNPLTFHLGQESLEVSLLWPPGVEVFPADVFVIAAPERMWEQVPESRLPVWPVGLPSEGLWTVRIPVGPPREAWRLRIVAGSYGSWWHTVEPGSRRHAVSLFKARPLETLGVNENDEPLAGTVMTVVTGTQTDRSRFLS